MKLSRPVTVSDSVTVTESTVEAVVPWTCARAVSLRVRLC